MAITSVRQAGLTGFTKYRSLADASGNPVFNIPGMVLLTPTSITHSGTSASIGANGQVTFTAVTSLSLNGVFSADFDNYAFVIRGVSSSNTDTFLRFRSSGSDATGSNYTYQYLNVTSTTVSPGRVSSQSVGRWGGINSTLENGYVVSVYGPFLAQPTAYRGVSSYSSSSAYISELAGTHSLSTSYDGLTLLTNSANTLTGKVAVYGIRS